MKIAIYGKWIHPEYLGFFENFITLLARQDAELTVHDNLWGILSKQKIEDKVEGRFSSFEDLSKETNLMCSLGGDGTLLDTITIVRNSEIPVMGINLGRLGFLANISKEEAEGAMQQVLKGDFELDRRTLISLESDIAAWPAMNYALNEFTVHKQETSSMITVEVHLNGKFLNTYRADGLIISTPTGSTGYSLSCGGPILFPETKSLIITPIAAHNLNVRPLVIDEESELKLLFPDKQQDSLISLDSRSTMISADVELTLKKSPFCINLIKLPGQDHSITLRNKLMWGIDKRN